MVNKKEETPKLWDLFMTKFKDIVFIVLFLATSLGWIVTSTTNKTKTKLILEQNTTAINELKTELKKVDEYMTKQAELNGQIIEYMKRDR